jgi:HEAT repeat protein
MNLPAFDRHFAQLVWLLVHRNDDHEQQKDVLRLALAECSERRHVLKVNDLAFAVANTYHDARVADLIVWISELSVRMSAHFVRALEFEQGASAHDVLGIARALVTQPSPHDEGAAFDERVIALGPKTVAAHLGGNGFVRRATPIQHAAAITGPARTPISGMAVIAADRSATPAVHGQDVMDEAVLDAPPSGIANEAPRIMQSEMTAVAPAARLKDLLGRLENASDSSSASKLIDDVAREAEERARQGLWVDLAEVLDRLYERTGLLHEGELKRAYQFAIRRLEKPALMHGIAKLLPRRREMREMVTRLLARTGEAGADALIDLLVSSESTTERHAYRTALGQCPAAVPALIHLLGDGRWYVVRNAVELLAELSPPDADGQMSTVLNHEEPRVRRAAASALGKLGTPRAMLALLQAVHDGSPEVRLAASLALGAIRNPRAVPWLVEALDKEQNAEVQGAMLSALGKMPTEDAVARLARAAEPGGMLLRKPVSIRLHAIEALAEAKTPSAQSVLRGLLSDRDRDIREAADRSLSGRAIAVES